MTKVAEIQQYSDHAYAVWVEETSESLSSNLIANYPSARIHRIDAFLVGYRSSETDKDTPR